LLLLHLLPLPLTLALLLLSVILQTRKKCVKKGLQTVKAVGRRKMKEVSLLAVTEGEGNATYASSIASQGGRAVPVTLGR
jgi:hypothetical protein